MGKKWKPPLREPAPGRPYVALVFDDLDIFTRARRDLVRDFGTVDYETPAFPAEGLTSLYGGAARSKVGILSFERLVGLEELPDLRKKTLSLEVKYQYEGRPLIELDPGYVAEYSVVRTALEEDFHRIYLYHGIYAEILYNYERRTQRPLEHTPPFYRRRDVITVFNDLALIRAGTH